LKREEAKLQKHADKVRQQLDALRAATKILGRGVAKGGKRIGKRKEKCLPLRERDFEGDETRWAEFRAAKAKGKR